MITRLRVLAHCAGSVRGTGVCRSGRSRGQGGWLLFEGRRRGCLGTSDAGALFRTVALYRMTSIARLNPFLTPSAPLRIASRGLELQLEPFDSLPKRVDDGDGLRFRLPVVALSSSWPSWRLPPRLRVKGSYATGVG
jgi:hypothetical protein